MRETHLRKRERGEREKERERGEKSIILEKKFPDLASLVSDSRHIHQFAEASITKFPRLGD
jgi:hypothetical protein